MFCEKCGVGLESGATFCQNCGTKVEVENLVVLEVMEPEMVEEPVHQSVYQEPVQEPVLQPVYQQPVPQPVPQPVYQQPVQQPMQQPVYHDPVDNPLVKPLSVGSYILMFIVMGIPFLNIVMVLVWAFGSNVNKNKKHYAIALIVLTLIFSVLSVVTVIFAGPIIAELISDIQYEYF